MMARRSTRGYGKGFGDLNCPGDPGCPGYIDPSINQAIVNAMAQNPSAAAPAPTSNVVSWMQNASWAIYAGAAVLVLLAISGGRR